MTIYKIIDQINFKFDYIDGTEDEANAKLAENRNAFMQREAYRFSITQVIVQGNDTIWTAADLENGSEDGDYRVFNHTAGEYELFTTLSSAKARVETLKTNLIAAANLDKWVVVDAIPDDLNQPSTTGTQTL